MKILMPLVIRQPISTGGIWNRQSEDLVITTQHQRGIAELETDISRSSVCPPYALRAIAPARVAGLEPLRWPLPLGGQ